ncbi:MAG: TetR/AcrR family transcriptional regulator [Polyangiaceae bacterium]|nr:TetR/AcrR family transcriptional regulator [Polyangiaceae bacterium]
MQRRSVDTVEVILHAAGRLLVAQGYARTSTNQIARVAGVSVGSLYQYFANKEAVFRELVRRHHEEVHALVEAHLREFADARRDPVEAIDRLLRKLIELHERNPRLMRAFARELGALRDQRPGPRAADREAVGVVEQLIRLRDDVHAEDPAATAWLLVVLVSRVSESLVHEAPLDLDSEPLLAQVRRVVAFLFGYPGKSSYSQ